MNCHNYLMLSPQEKIKFIGMLIHAAQSDNEIFNKCEAIIKKAEKSGVFEGVTINPSTTNPDIDNIIN